MADGYPFRQLLAHPHINDTVRIHSHADGQDQPGDTRKGKRYIKRVHEPEVQECKDDKRPSCREAGYTVHNYHKKDNQENADHAGSHTGRQRLLPEGRPYDIGVNFFQLQGQRPDTDVRGKVLRFLKA